MTPVEKLALDIFLFEYPDGKTFEEVLEHLGTSLAKQKYWCVGIDYKDLECAIRWLAADMRNLVTSEIISYDINLKNIKEHLNDITSDRRNESI